MNQILFQYGVAGVAIVGMGLFIMYLMKTHSEDRKEWFKALDQLLDKQNRTIKDVGEGHDKALKDMTDKYDKRQGEINETFLTAFKQAFDKK